MKEAELNGKSEYWKERAEKDLIEAYRWVEDETDRILREEARVRVARAQVIITGEVTYRPEYFLEVARGMEGVGGNDLLEGVALLLVQMGRMEEARVVVGETYGLPRFGLEMARVCAIRGGDAREWIDWVYGKLQEGDAGDVRLAGEVVELERELGLEGSSGRVERLANYEGGDHVHAEFLNTEAARAYAKEGLVEKAFEVWWYSRKNSLLERLETLAYIATAMARRGEDIEEVSRLVIEDLSRVDGAGVEMMGLVKTRVCARLIEAIGVSGGEVGDVVRMGMEMAREEEGNLRAEAYLELGKALGRGRNPRAKELLVLARMVADAEEEESEELESQDAIGRIARLLVWEEVFGEQVKLGYFDDARETLSRFDIGEPNGAARGAVMLAQLAEAEFELSRVPG